MLNDILQTYENSNYDFRENACIDDPMAEFFEEWVEYYRLKWSISKVLKPATIMEIGVRYGYSARAFLEGAPNARLVGIDADLPMYGGQPGAVDWAEQSLAGQYDVTIIKDSSLNFTRFPGDVFDLIHIDGQQDGDATFNDLDKALVQARHILVDGYFWTRINFLAVNEWLWLNKAAIAAVITIPGYAGELLIKTKVPDDNSVNANHSLALALTYTKDYYLKDCGGYEQWRRSKGKSIDPRLQAVADVGMSLNSHRRVLDLGAGRGELTRLFAKQGSEVTAIDYSKDAVELIKKTMGDSHNTNVNVICDSVLNPDIYDQSYDLAVASDIVEHLSPEEDDALYNIVSEKLRHNKGALVVHTAPNQWFYRYEHPRQQKAAIQAGFWLPRTRRTWYERLMHVNEQNPRVLKRQLLRYFPHVLIWFTDTQNMGGSLLRRFSIAELRRARSIFAVASHRPIDSEKLKDLFRMAPLTSQEAENVTLQVDGMPMNIRTDEVFLVSAKLNNATDIRLVSILPYAFNLSYHWLDEDGKLIVFDGHRSILDSPLNAHSQASYSVTIKAPSNSGRYILRVLPVQEEVRWHEAANISGDSTIVVS